MSESVTIINLFAEVVERLANEFGHPMPEEVLTTGDKEKGWWVKFNNTPQEVDGLLPLDITVRWNGWPCAVLGPTGGISFVGDFSNDESFKEWLNE